MKKSLALIGIALVAALSFACLFFALLDVLTWYEKSQAPTAVYSWLFIGGLALLLTNLSFFSGLVDKVCALDDLSRRLAEAERQIEWHGQRNSDLIRECHHQRLIIGEHVREKLDTLSAQIQKPAKVAYVGHTTLTGVAPDANSEEPFILSREKE